MHRRKNKLIENTAQKDSYKKMAKSRTTKKDLEEKISQLEKQIEQKTKGMPQNPKGSLPKGHERPSTNSSSDAQITREEENQRDVMIYNIIKKIVDDEWARSRNLDKKAGSLVGFTLIAVGFLLGSGTLGLFQGENINFGIATIFLVGVGTLILAIGFGLYAMRVKSWDIIDVERLLDEYTKASFRTVLRRTAATWAETIKDMTPEVNNKAAFVKKSWGITILGLVIVFIFVIVAVAFGVTENNVSENISESIEGSK